jgi:hypothetical protein
VRGRRGDDVDHFHALVAGPGPGAADLGNLDRAGEVQEYGRCRDFDRAPHPPPVPDLDGRHGADLGPRQGLAPGEQAGLVAFHGEHVVPTPADDVGRGRGLGARRIGGDHGPDQVKLNRHGSDAASL